MREPGSKHAYQKASRGWPSGLQIEKGIESFVFFKVKRELNLLFFLRSRKFGEKMPPRAILSFSL